MAEAPPLSAPGQRDGLRGAPALVPVIPVVFLKHARTYTFFSAVTALGTPQDVTLQELRIECFFPMDEETDQNMRAMMESGVR